jgi:large subunit ribosomal protein L10
VHDVLVIRGGVLEGEAVSDAEIKRLATLPPTDVLRAQLAGAVAGPLTTIVGLFTAPLRDLVGVIDARIEQLREQGDMSEGDAPTAEAAPELETQNETEEDTSAEGDQPSAEQETEEE